jgi:hypothetical protein
MTTTLMPTQQVKQSSPYVYIVHAPAPGDRLEHVAGAYLAAASTLPMSQGAPHKSSPAAPPMARSVLTTSAWMV